MLVALLAAAAAMLPPPVSGDFDRDGKADVAAVIAVDGGYDLVLRPGARDRAEIRVARLRAGDMSGFYLGKAAPGVQATACTKDLGLTTDLCAVKRVTLTGDTLQFGTREASRAVALWQDNQFQVVWLDD